MNTNKTAEIFNLVVAETIIDGRHGLSAHVVAALAGCAGLHAENEDQFVREVMSQSEIFTDVIDSKIESVECEYECDSASHNSDLDALKVMLGWTFDEAEMEAMARLDWKEHHGQE